MTKTIKEQLQALGYDTTKMPKPTGPYQLLCDDGSGNLIFDYLRAGLDRSFFAIDDGKLVKTKTFAKPVVQGIQGSDDLILDFPRAH